MTDQVFIRICENFNLELFLEKRTENLKYFKVSDAVSTHQQCDSFVKYFTDVVNAHVLLKKATRKEKPLKFKLQRHSHSRVY